MNTFRDKLVGLALVIVGLAFIAEMHPTGGILMLGALVVMGGIGSVVSSQVLATAIRYIEQSAGISTTPIMSAPSAAKSDQENG
jgi:hypothetical protein